MEFLRPPHPFFPCIPLSLLNLVYWSCVISHAFLFSFFSPSLSLKGLTRAEGTSDPRSECAPDKLSKSSFVALRSRSSYDVRNLISHRSIFTRPRKRVRWSRSNANSRRFEKHLEAFSVRLAIRSSAFFLPPPVPWLKRKREIAVLGAQQAARRSPFLDPYRAGSTRGYNSIRAQGFKRIAENRLSQEPFRR